MLHAKFRGNRIFEGFLSYMRGGHLGQVTRMPSINFRSPYPMRLYIKFGFDWPCGFRGDV